MADNIVLLKIDVQEANANDRLERLRKSTKDLKEGSDEYVLVLKKIQIEEDRLANLQAKRIKIQNNSVKDTDRVTSALNNQKDATGSATAATMELSRIVSDAPYGIRGMANNITQLVSQLGTASKSAGGLGAAIKLMISQLMGPLGVVFAITAAVSAFDYFYGGAKKAAKAMKEFTSISYAQSLVAEQYVDILEDVNTTESYRAVAVQELIKLVPELKKEDLAYGKNLDKVREQIALYSLAQASRIEIDKLVQDNSELLSRKNELENIKKIKNEKEMLEEMSKFIFEQGKEVSGFYVGFGVKKLIEEKDLVQTKETFNRLSKIINSQSKPIIERIQKLTKSLRLDPDKSSKGKKGTVSKIIDPKSFEADLFEIEKMLNNFRFQDVKDSAKTEQEKAAAKSLIELDKFTSNYKEYTENENKKFAKFKEDLNKQLEAKKISEATYNNALGVATEKKRKGDTVSYENYLKGLRAISKQYSPDIIGEGITVTTTLAEQAKKDAKIKLDGQLNAFLEYAKSAKIALTEISSFLQAESDRELTIEQNKTNALNQELNNRLLNENLSKDQRASIQNQIAINDEKLRKKQNKIKEKAFKTQKAFNIALAVTDTITAGIGAARATYGGPIAKIAAMTATIGAGMLQVAMIARQKFQPDAANTPVNVGSSGAGGGSARAEPSFNIVGRSNENILMSAIQSQFDQPLRAYVVARDVTNQQQLDGVISGAAGT